MTPPWFSYQVISYFVSISLSSASSYAIRALARDPWVRPLFTLTFCASEGSLSKNTVCFSVCENGTTQPIWKQWGTYKSLICGYWTEYYLRERLLITLCEYMIKIPLTCNGCNSTLQIKSAPYKNSRQWNKHSKHTVKTALKYNIAIIEIGDWKPCLCKQLCNVSTVLSK